MTGLEEFNRQEWAGVHYTLRLVGGLCDGQEITWGCLPEIWRHPVRMSLAEFLEDPASALWPVTHVVEYVQTGSVADDGARLYRMRRS